VSQGGEASPGRPERHVTVLTPPPPLLVSTCRWRHLYNMVYK
jgi:hypothetical protein